MRTALAIAAHPDDIEFFMAGTMLLLKQAGYELHYFTIANGCCGSTKWSAQHTATVRRAEAIAAAEMLGAAFHPSITNDLEIFFDDRLLRHVAAIVREVSPEILLTHSPADYMEDHTNACRLAVTAAFAAGCRTIEPSRRAHRWSNPSRSTMRSRTATAIRLASWSVRSCSSILETC